ncbi:MAG: alpha/beta hydrolase [Acidimicrobiales bacterium]|nr:alpha/beta hydrolase [Acidimicrobiales bacterium]
MTNTTTHATTTTPDLYWEARGAGSPILLIPGTPGDGGQFDAVAADLADDHLVITYDRRGTSRSAAPKGWSQTSVGEQADDAASLLSRVGVGPAVVFGTSNGAAVALELAMRHPARVAAVMLHEMPLLSVLQDPEPVASAMEAVIGTAMDAGGPRAALEAFLRFAFGDPIVDGWPAEYQERVFANAEMVFAVEMPAFQSYRPGEVALAGCETQVAVAVGRDQQLPFFSEACHWLAAKLDTTVSAIPGAHGPQFSSPDHLATSLRTFIETAPAG